MPLESGFFEFVDEAEKGRFAWELQPGRRYRLLVTTASGLYRYDTRDIVSVVGHSGRTPRLRFLGRAGAAADLCGEKLTEEFVLACFDDIGLSAVSYAVLVAVPEARPHYRLYLESRARSGMDGSVCERLDAALSANPQYEYARRIGQLPRIEMSPVEDLYGRVKRHRMSGGASLAGMKAPVLIGEADAGLLAALESDAA